MFLSTQWETWAQGIVLIASVVAALTYLAHRIVKFGKAAFHGARRELREAIAEDTRSQFDEIRTRLDVTDTRLRTVENEVTFNSGHSLKDAVFSIKRMLESEARKPVAKSVAKSAKKSTKKSLAKRSSPRNPPRKKAPK